MRLRESEQVGFMGEDMGRENAYRGLSSLSFEVPVERKGNGLVWRGWL